MVVGVPEKGSSRGSASLQDPLLDLLQLQLPRRSLDLLLPLAQCCWITQHLLPPGHDDLRSSFPADTAAVCHHGDHTHGDASPETSEGSIEGQPLQLFPCIPIQN